MILLVIFYVLSAALLLSAGMVITSRNPVHSVLFLILAFFNGAGLFLMTGAEFLAMALVIVYVGAVAVLFLFVVMMLDVDFASLSGGFQRYAPVGATVGAVLLGELLLVFTGWRFTALPQAPLTPPVAGVANTAALGRVMYTQYLLLFQVAGVVLLVAMIGAIVLTLRDRRSSKRQDIDRQVNRAVSDTLVMVPVPLGAGMGQIGIFRPPGAEHPAGDKAPHAKALPNAGGRR